MELINIYDNKRKNTKKIVERYNYKTKDNEFSLSVQIWIMNDNGEILLTKRANKLTYPFLWECTEGVVDAGETSLDAAIREVKEEIGIDIFPNEIVKLKIDEEKEYPKYTDVYLCKKNSLANDILLQKDECTDFKFVDENIYNNMCKNNEIVPHLNYFYDIYRKNQKYINSQNMIYIDNTKKYLKGNLHTHTTNSDGMYSVNEVLDIYKNNEYDFLAITDHDIFCNNNYDKINDIVLLHGIEYSCIYNGSDETKGEYTHFNCFLPKNSQSDEIYYYKDINEFQCNINKLNRKYSLIQFNHPLFSKFLDNEFIQFNNYNLIEIYNHKDFIEETGMQNAELLIRNLLNHHKKVLITATDDFHGPYTKTINDKCFGGYIMLDSKKNELDILNSIKDGKFYPTTGPVIFDYRMEGRILKIKTSPVKNIIFYSNLRRCKNCFSKDNTKINNAEYVLNGDEFYIWVKIIDFNGKMAWTQPVYIDNSIYLNK